MQTDCTGNWPLVLWEQKHEWEERRKEGNKVFDLTKKITEAGMGRRGVRNEKDCFPSHGSFSTLASKYYAQYCLAYNNLFTFT